MHESYYNVSRPHALYSLEDGEALEAAAVFVKDTGEAAGVLRIVENGEERGHIGLGRLEPEAAIKVRDADPLDGERCILCGEKC